MVAFALPDRFIFLFPQLLKFLHRNAAIGLVPAKQEKSTHQSRIKRLLIFKTPTGSLSKNQKKYNFTSDDDTITHPDCRLFLQQAAVRSLEAFCINNCKVYSFVGILYLIGDAGRISRTEFEPAAERRPLEPRRAHQVSLGYCQDYLALMAHGKNWKII